MHMSLEHMVATVYIYVIVNAIMGNVLVVRYDTRLVMVVDISILFPFSPRVFILVVIPCFNCLEFEFLPLFLFATVVDPIPPDTVALPVQRSTAGGHGDATAHRIYLWVDEMFERISECGHHSGAETRDRLSRETRGSNRNMGRRSGLNARRADPRLNGRSRKIGHIDTRNVDRNI
jgi:hypothetical protein